MMRLDEAADPADALMRERRAELGAFLRRRRAELVPADIGLTPVGRRHVKGLRREEVAAAARIGVSWYTMLEQGRVERVTTRTLDAISEALQLSTRERGHLRALAAGSLDDLNRDDAAPPPSLLEFARRYPLGGAFVHDSCFDVVAANRFAEQMFGFDRVAAPNLLDLMVSNADVRAVFVAPTWYETLQRMVGHFRIRYATSGGAAHVELAERLCAESPEFRDVWGQRPIVDPPTESCAIRHPIAGALTVQMIALVPPAAPSYTLILNNRVELTATR